MADEPEQHYSRHANGQFAGQSFEAVYAEIRRLDQLRLADQTAVSKALDEEKEAKDALRRESRMFWDAHAREHIVHEAAHNREHAFSQTAIDTAAELAKENKADANEWRGTMDDREMRFATNSDVDSILRRLDKIERSELVSIERDNQRTIADAAHKEETMRRTARAQWTVGLIIGTVATVGSVLINLVLRLTSN